MVRRNNKERRRSLEALHYRGKYLPKIRKIKPV